MDYVVLDTDVASLSFKKRELPPSVVAALVGNQPCITFVTLAELIKWSVLRQWGEVYRRRLELWLRNVVVLPYDEDVARTWESWPPTLCAGDGHVHRTICGSPHAASATALRWLR